MSWSPSMRRGQTCGTHAVVNTPCGLATALRGRDRDAACVRGIENSGSLGKGFAQFLLGSGETAVHEIVPHRTAQYRKRPQKAAGYDGMIGQYHVTQVVNASQVDMTMWVSQAHGDRVIMIFQCDPARDVDLDRAVAQVPATIDFDAR